MSKHTPTPWFRSHLYIADLMRGVVTAEAANERDAAFIIRAVNSHEEMLKVLRLIVLNGQIGGSFLKAAVKAIAQAESKNL